MVFGFGCHLANVKKNPPSALKRDHAALKLIGNNSGSVAGWKESKKELWAEFRR